MLASTLTALLALACTAEAHPDSAQVAASVRALGSAFEPYADRFADNGVDGAILVEYSPAGAAGSITDLLSELDIQKPLHRQVLAKHLQNLVHAVNETAPTTRRRLDRSTTAVADAASLTRNETELKEALMSGYDSNTQPADLLVRVQVAMLVFPEIDTTAQTVKMVGWWRSQWTDERLAWDRDAWGGVPMITFPGTSEDSLIVRGHRVRARPHACAHASARAPSLLRACAL